MPVFTYKAFDAEESAVSGTLVADTPRQVREQLLDRGLTVQEVVPRSTNTAEKPTGGFRWPGRRHSAAALTFIRELATLLGAGIPLLDSRPWNPQNHPARPANAACGRRSDSPLR